MSLTSPGQCGNVWYLLQIRSPSFKLFTRDEYKMETVKEKLTAVYCTWNDTQGSVVFKIRVINSD